MRHFVKAVLLPGLVLLLTVAAMGQREAGQITGTVTDPTGAVVSGATVTATSVGTGMARTATSNSTGAYTISGLKPDTYKVAVEAKGFRKISQTLEVGVGSSAELSVKLEIGDASQVVEVTATTGAVVNTTDQTLSESITSRELNELPTSPTRNPYALVGISGNVAEDTGSMRGAGYAVNGMRSASTDILLDGGENVDSFTAGVGQIVPLDSVQEFSVLTNNFTAEYGRASGGVVNVVTKSGTNAFHGSAYEYNRISALSANTYQNDASQTPKGGFTRNDFGFSLGGPIKKNKLFFFNNTEWIRVRSAAPQNFTIIDPASISSLAPASQAFFTQYGHLGPVRTVATGPCSATVANSPTCDSIVFSVPTDAGGGAPQNTWMEVARIDYTITDKTTLFGRYASYKELDFPGFVNSSPYTGYNTGQTNYDQNFEFNIMHVFGPSITNTAKVIFNRLNGPVQPLATAPVSPTLYTASSVPNVNVGGNNFPLVFPGYNMTGPGLGLPFGGPQNLYEFYDDMAWVHGKHQFKFGGQFMQLRDNRTFGAYENPVELLGKNLDSGITNLMNGEIYQFQGAVYPQGKFPCVNDLSTGAPIVTPACTLSLPVAPPRFGRNYRYNDGGAYAQDSWKVVPRLTVNLGVRWEYYGVQHNANPSLDSNFVMGSGATIFDQVRNGQVKLAKDGGVFWKPQYRNFGPRVGFAWDVFGDGKTALRGGFGISYERNFGNVTFNAIQNPPNYAVISLVNASVNSGVGDVPTLPVYTDTAGPLAGTGSKALPAVSQRAINQNLKSAYAETWNLSMDHQLGAGVLSIAYAGSHGVHGYDIANVNPLGGGGLYLGDARAGNRLNPQYGNMNFRSDQSYSHYAAVNAKYSVNNLLHKGASLTANYTWSHALDNLSSTFSDSNGASQSGLYQLGYLDAFNPKLNYGNADFDIRHRLAISGTWELPWMKTGGNAIGRNVLGGWALGSIFSVRSGSPFSIYDCTNATQTACPLLAPGQVLPTTGTPSAAGINAFNYIALPTYADTTCAPKHTPPCTGPSIVGTSRDGSLDSLGDPNCTGLFHVGCTYTPDGRPYPERNQFFGPHYWNMDLNFYKTFKITERFGLQFRGEFYNIFNHHNQYVNTENLDVSSLSTPFIQTEKGGPYGFPGICTTGGGCDERRNIQFGLKLFF